MQHIKECILLIIELIRTIYWLIIKIIMLNICLTGFDSKEKTTLAKFIEELGDIGFKL